MKKIFLSIAIINTILSCKHSNSDSNKYSIQIENYSSKNVYVYIKSKEDKKTMYTDTTLFLNKEMLLAVKPINEYPSFYKTIMEISVHPFTKDSLSIFIFSRAAFDSYGREKKDSGYKLQKQYDVSIHDLQCLDCIITFPPTEKMKNIKMYPHYTDTNLYRINANIVGTKKIRYKDSVKYKNYYKDTTFYLKNYIQNDTSVRFAIHKNQERNDTIKWLLFKNNQSLIFKGPRYYYYFISYYKKREYYYADEYLYIMNKNKIYLSSTYKIKNNKIIAKRVFDFLGEAGFVPIEEFDKFIGGSIVGIDE